MKILFVFIVLVACLLAQASACAPRIGWWGCPKACGKNPSSQECKEACKRWPNMVNCPPQPAAPAPAPAPTGTNNPQTPANQQTPAQG